MFDESENIYHLELIKFWCECAYVNRFNCYKFDYVKWCA